MDSHFRKLWLRVAIVLSVSFLLVVANFANFVVFTLRLNESAAGWQWRIWAVELRGGTLKLYDRRDDSSAHPYMIGTYRLYHQAFGSFELVEFNLAFPQRSESHDVAGGDSIFDEYASIRLGSYALVAGVFTFGGLIFASRTRRPRGFTIIAPCDQNSA